MAYIAACGLVCDGCDFILAPENPDLAGTLADWLTGELNRTIKPEEVFCEGCRGPRDRHWSADCWILKCCVDERNHENCSECAEFPCERLVEWAGQNERYKEALERLKKM